MSRREARARGRKTRRRVDDERGRENKRQTTLRQRTADESKLKDIRDKDARSTADARRNELRRTYRGVALAGRRRLATWYEFQHARVNCNDFVGTR